jgi:phosphoglycerate dehydrogenase-like enzyme
MATPLNKLRILFCGVEFPGAVHHTQQFLKHYPHISIGVWPREEVADKIADYDMCVVRMMRLDSAVIARATSLKLIVQFGVGLEGKFFCVHLT